MMYHIELHLFREASPGLRWLGSEQGAGRPISISYDANTSFEFPSFCSFQIILVTMDGQSPSLALSAAMSDNANKTLFLEKVRDSNHACQAGDFKLAVRLYTEAIALDPGNHILHSNRSAAYIKMGQFPKALQDAIRARDLNPEWPKVS